MDDHRPVVQSNQALGKNEIVGRIGLFSKGAREVGKGR
tara:strand:+ start:689 stop:802 length:114 start_codon:yes stop_codon:yes gene_type:complete